MSKTRWVVEGNDDDTIELGGHKFATADTGAPMLCSLFCTAQGRHTHIDFCREVSARACTDPAVSHIRAATQPNPERAKDWVTHELHWQRLGFKDPYTAVEQADFTKCDAMCSGDEHKEAEQQPSFCTLPMFHLPHPVPAANPLAREYVSNDGHRYECSNPASLHQAFHIIFAIDTSGSMTMTDRTPVPGTPSTATIAARSNNRLGAVYSALHSFWMARQAAIGRSGGTVGRRDAYSVLLHDHFAQATSIINDFTRTPDQLLQELLPHEADGGNDFEAALGLAQSMMETHWSTERAPVLIFLSDGEWTVPETKMYDITRRAMTLGKPLSFHAVSFGMGDSACLRRMTAIAAEIETRNPLIPLAAHIPSSYTEVMSSIRLTEAFLGFAESMRKPRASLMRQQI